MHRGLDKGFYFSYTYDLTRSLQETILRKVVKQEKVTRARSQSASPMNRSGDNLFGGSESLKPPKKSKDESETYAQATLRNHYPELYLHDLLQDNKEDGGI